MASKFTMSDCFDLMLAIRAAKGVADLGLHDRMRKSKKLRKQVLYHLRNKCWAFKPWKRIRHL